MIGLANVSFFFGRERWNFSKFRKEQNPARLLYSPELTSSWWYWVKYHLFDVLRNQKYALFSKSSSIRTTTSLHSREQTSPSPERRHTSTVRAAWSYAKRFVTSTFSSRSPHRGGRYATEDTEADIEHVPKRNGNGRTWNTPHKSPSQGEKSQGDSFRPSARNTMENDVAYFEKYIKQIQNFSLLRSTADSTRIKDLQFSPDGRWLVVCYKYSCTVYDVVWSILNPSSHRIIISSSL